MRYLELLSKNDDLKTKKGGWRPGTGAGGKRTATFSCPECGKDQPLPADVLAIDAIGNTLQPVRCQDEDCGFSDFVNLMEWDQKPA